jgi:hypothetical protein
MSRTTLHPQPLRQRNLRLGLAVLGFMLFLYALSVVGVLVLN